MRGELRVVAPGLVPFDEAWELQRELAQTGESWLVLLEHPPVFTLGKFADARNVLDPRGIPVVRIDRGGDVTYHGPGQLVGYPILSLRERRIGVREHVRRIERALVAALADLGVAARRRDDGVGVWTDRGKIASIGVRVARGVTMHGFALNVDMDLAAFTRINPCGVPACAVTSMARELGRAVGVQEAADRVVPHLAREFRFERFSVAARPGRGTIEVQSRGET